MSSARRRGLKQGRKVGRETVSNALTKVRKQYEKRDRLEATTTLRKLTYNQARKQVDYDFNANQGPLVKVVVDGAKLSQSRLKLLVPIYQEGTVDNDLLNEGTFNIKDFLFQEGYFDATVAVQVEGAGTPSESVVYSVNEGVKHKVASVTIVGNHYFDTDLLKERMQVAEGRCVSAQRALLAATDEGGYGFDPGALPGERIRQGDDLDRDQGRGHVEVGEEVEGAGDRSGGDDRGRAAAEVRHGGADRRGQQPGEGREGAAELAAGTALLADYAVGGPGRDPGLLPEPRLCGGKGRGEAAAGERRCREDGCGRWT